MSLSHFFVSPSVLILKATALVLFRLGKPPEQLEFPPEVLFAMEVRDENKLKELLVAFIDSVGLAQSNCILLLVPELVFRQQIPATIEPTVAQEVQQTFRNSLAFNQHDLVIIKKQNQNGFELQAINGDLIQEILQVFKSKEVVVTKIFPADTVDLNVAEELTPKLLKMSIKKANRVPEQLNLLSKLPVADRHLNKSSNAKSKVGIGLAALFTLVSIAVAGVLIWTTLNSNKSQSEHPALEVQDNQVIAPEESQTASEVAEEVDSPVVAEYVTKEELVLSVLNGSGVSGQAALIKQKLEELGFVIISTGNAARNSNIETEVSFSNRVNPEYKQEIINVLEEIFADVVFEDLDGQSEVDVTVTTRSAIQ